MKDDTELQKLTTDLIEKAKWVEFLKRFIDVLRINIFLVDYAGRIFIPPYAEGAVGRYGSNFLTTSFGFDFSGKESNLISNFHQHGSYLEAKDPSGFRIYAIPFNVDENHTIAYMLVGPVILNKRSANEEYKNIAKELKLKDENVISALQEIRVVSFVTIKAILDLLSEVVRDILQLNLEKKKLHQMRFNKEILPKEFSQVAQDLYATIHFDELLVTILDIALKLTTAECGSIMILDENQEFLLIKVSRGLDAEKIQKTKIKIGEGISGLAAKENQSFYISEKQHDNRLKNMLNRPDIKQAIIMPLATQNRVFGVMNLHTKRDDSQIKSNINNLKHLSKLISTAIKSI